MRFSFSPSQKAGGLLVALVAFAGLTFTSGQFVPAPGASGGGSINGGVAQTCAAGSFIDALTGGGTAHCAAVPAIPTPSDFAFGAGGDGALVFDGSTTITVNGVALVPAANVYTLATDIEATNLTVNNGVTIKTAGWRIFGTGTCTDNGTISDNGNNGNNGTATTAGTGGAARAAGYYTATPAGINGGVNATTTADAASYPRGIGVASFASSTSGGGAGGAAFGGSGTAGADGSQPCVGGASGGGGGWSGGAAGGQASSGGAITFGAVNRGDSTVRTLEAGTIVTPQSTSSTFPITLSGTGGGGGAPGGGATAPGGGGGGAPGGIVYEACKTLAGSGAYQAKGGNGGNGGGNNGAGQGGSAGGGGGGGGLVVLVYSTSTGAWTTDVSGGTKGNGSSGGAGGGAGAAGGNGAACKTLKYNLSGDGT